MSYGGLLEGNATPARTKESHPPVTELSEIARRWSLVLGHRERLLRIALARTSNRPDAEDCVQEALIRCVGFADLDTSRIGPILTSIVVRLCVDSHRRQQRDSRVRHRLGEPPTPVTPEDLVCDKDAGEWAAAQIHVLPTRERDVLLSRASGFTVAETANALGVTYKAVDAAFTRARSRMRLVLKGAVALVGLALVGRRTVSITATVLVGGSLTLAGTLPLPSQPDLASPGPHHVIAPAPGRESGPGALAEPGPPSSVNLTRPDFLSSSATSDVSTSPDLPVALPALPTADPTGLAPTARPPQTPPTVDGSGAPSGPVTPETDEAPVNSTCVTSTVEQAGVTGCV